MTAILWAAIGYLLGSVPFGIVITRMLGLGDLRLGEGDDELVAAVAEREVRLSQRNAHAIGEGFEQMIARGAPLSFQTAAPARIGDYKATLEWAVKAGSNSVELMIGSPSSASSSRGTSWSGTRMPIVRRFWRSLTSMPSPART